MELELRNVGIIKSAHLEFIQGLNLIVGSSSSGKSTLLRAIKCMMDNSFSDSNVSYGQKKLAIRMIYNNHSATYIRDLDNPSRKSAYQIDGKVYTKLGRSSLDDLSSLFKLSPVEIDGEKINFNFSAQFSGPFLLLGSPSLLYSILTYRSTLDITKINDLYFSDLKKVKQDISVLVKTKESLDKEKELKEKSLQKLEPFPSAFIRLQKLKQQYEELQKQRSAYSSYKDISRSINLSRNKLDKINKILDSYTGYSSSLNHYLILSHYINAGDQINIIKTRLQSIVRLNALMIDLFPKYEYSELLRNFIRLNNTIDHNRNILSKILIPDYSIISLLKKYISTHKSKDQKEYELQNIQQKLSGVLKSINEVGVCPLCNQPISNH